MTTDPSVSTPSSADPSTGTLSIAPELGRICSDYLEAYRGEVTQNLERNGLALAQRYAASLDGLLSALFCAGRAFALSQHGAQAEDAGRIALVAVGGYGRSTVALHSDVDLLVLCDRPDHPVVASIAESILYPVWDAGLQIGHAVRGIGETAKLAQHDLRTATTLIDMRSVAGDHALVDELAQLCRRHVFEPSLNRFLDLLREDMADRHARFGGSLFMLEPELKMGRGGLRDTDVALWAARARWGVRSLSELVRIGALTRLEHTHLQAAREHLWTVRGLLHVHAGRRQDRLTFADQERLAELRGYAEKYRRDATRGSAMQHEGALVAGVEEMMQEHYRHASAIARLAERVIDRAYRKQATVKRKVSRDPAFLVIDDRVTIADGVDFETEPARALALVYYAVKLGLKVYGRVQDRLMTLTGDAVWAEKLRSDAEARELFLRLLQHTGEIKTGHRSAIALLHELGLLTAMIPEFAEVTGRMQHDVYHVYTVDVHSIAAVDRLAGTFRGDFRNEIPLATRQAAEVAYRAPLFFAVLLHDIGKAHGRDHSEVGAKMARNILERLGLPPAEIDHVCWLVEEHLSLYHWATRRDLSDAETIREICERTSNRGRLRDLYLLTLSDLATTNPQALTTWKRDLISELFNVVSAAFRSSPAGAVSKRAKERRRAVVGQLGDESLVERVLVGLPDRYFLGSTTARITEHVRALEKGTRDVLVRAWEIEGSDRWEILVAARDEPGLLSRIAAIFASEGLAIQTAQLFTREEAAGYSAVDIFRVKPREMHIGAHEQVADRVERALSDGRHDAVDLSRKAPSWSLKHFPEVRTHVAVESDHVSRFTVVEVFTRDRPGLLYFLADELYRAGVSVRLAKINTEGHRALDVFHVVDAEGRRIDSPDALLDLRDRLLDRLKSLPDV